METPKFTEFSVTVKLTVQARMEMEAHTIIQGMLLPVLREQYLTHLVSIGDIVPACMPHRRAYDQQPHSVQPPIMGMRDIACLLPGAAA